MMLSDHVEVLNSPAAEFIMSSTDLAQGGSREEALQVAGLRHKV